MYRFQPWRVLSVHLIHSKSISSMARDIESLDIETYIDKQKGYLDLLVEPIMSDYYVRELAQREETLEEKGQALRKMQNTDEDEAELRKLDEEQKTLRKAYWYQEWKFYNWQGSIPGLIKIAYETLRENPKWYMQKELTRDCAARGGCCGRGCGCCEKRESTPGRNMGVGHCTTGCGCCSNFRECELTEKEMGDITGALRATLNYSDRAYLLTLSRAYLLGDKKVEKKVNHVDSAPKLSKWREIMGRK
ncbi:unnamed protein product [Penicillium nalgiovense]|nr:unnamed protein product [Penicillium nalgiovense]